MPTSVIDYIGLVLYKYKQHERLPHPNEGFTLVELLIVIVVIGILAAITLVAYNGVQAKAQDAARSSDITAITKALELYYVDHGYYPSATNYTPGSSAINAGWSTTADGSWSNLIAVLKPYAQNLPVNTPTKSTTPAVRGGDSYDYMGFANSLYCGSSAGQGYILIYHMDGSQQNKLIGNCTGTALGPYSGASNYRVVKG